MTIAPGTTYGAWEILREVDRAKTNRRFECRCAGCGTVTIKWLSNLLQGKTSCLTCRPWSEVNLAGRNAVIAERQARSQESDTGRICLTCGEWKPWSEFGCDPRRTRGRTSNCKECHRQNRVARIYGLTRDELLWLLETQGNTCALCGTAGTVYRGESLSIDHDHACCGSGRACKKCIRGLLCSHCNRFLLAYVEPRPLLRVRFADYLDQRPFTCLPARFLPAHPR